MIMKRAILLYILLIGNFYAMADKLSFRTDAPDAVVSGDQFRLCYTINTQKVSNFRAPSINGFEVLMGPSRSQQSSTQIINGNVSSSSSITFTYILQASKTGTFSIPGATIVAEGKPMTSNSVRIKVLPPDHSVSNNNNNNNNKNTQNSSSTSRRISGKDLFITATASRTNVYEQEAILLTYKVYTTLNLTQLNGNMPDLKGFHTQEVELPRSKSFSLEHFNGRNYKSVVWSQYVLFPQQTGTLTVPSIKFDGIIEQELGSVDPFDAFFNGGTNISEFKKSIMAPQLTIHVSPLPGNKPASFGGAVGQFTLSSSVNSNKVRTNDALTLRLIISGTGNMKLIGNPKVNFPKDFEVYDPKVTDKFSLTKNGLTGNKIIDYLAVPRHPGNFKIPAIEFTYFDINSRSYRTIQTKEFEITVEKGNGNASQAISDFTNKEDVQMLGQDIRYIKLNNNTVYKLGDTFFGSFMYYLCYIVPLVLFVLFIIIYRKQIAENANVAKMKNKKANKVATKRLKAAGSLLQDNKKNEFYDEVLRALWGYVSDKLNIPLSQLSKDNIESELRKYGVGEELIKSYLNAMNECEFARYAPGDPNQAMDNVYDKAANAITEMENTIK